MRARRLASALVVLTVSAGLATGCGSGDSDAFLPRGEPAAPPSGPASRSAPVVVAGSPRDVLRRRDAAAAAAARSRRAAAAAEARRREARRKLRAERARAARARRRAAAREVALRDALRASRRRAAAPIAEAAPPSPRPAPAPITGSGTGPSLVAERDRRSASEARASVIRFHELLDASDPEACGLLTRRLLEAFYGAEPGADGRCRSAVAEFDAAVSVVVAESRARGARASVAVVSRVDDSEVAQTLTLLLQDGTWRIDAAERRAR